MSTQWGTAKTNRYSPSILETEAGVGELRPAACFLKKDLFKHVLAHLFACFLWLLRPLMHESWQRWCDHESRKHLLSPLLQKRFASACLESGRGTGMNKLVE